MQHFHGFTDGRNATCAKAAADTSHDGIVDLLETEPTSGTTMVPFPTSVASLGTIPAQVTLPIACGKIEVVRQ